MAPNPRPPRTLNQKASSSNPKPPPTPTKSAKPKTLSSQSSSLDRDLSRNFRTSRQNTAGKGLRVQNQRSRRPKRKKPREYQTGDHKVKILGLDGEDAESSKEAEGEESGGRDLERLKAVFQQRLEGSRGARRHLEVPGNISGANSTSGGSLLAEDLEERGETRRVKIRPGSFRSFGLSDEVCRGMNAAGYTFPTPIQRKVMPAALSGVDVIAMARTGSGKTAAFLAPTIHRISNFLAKKQEAGDTKVQGVRGLIILPTRELALQTFQFFKQYSRYTGITGCVVAGGESLEAQFAALASNPDLVIATPGRLLQLLQEVPTLTLKKVRILVLDEADRLFESSLIAEIEEILGSMQDPRIRIREPRLAPDLSDPTKLVVHAPGAFSLGNGSETEASRGITSHKRRQTILISATMPVRLKEFASTKLSEDRVVVRLDSETILSPTLRVGFYYVPDEFKLPALLFLLKDHMPSHGGQNVSVREAAFAKVTPSGLIPGLDGPAQEADSRQENRKRCLVFCATKHTVELLVDILTHAKLQVCGVHGRMDQDQRNQALNSFKNRELDVLIVTDLAARGLDIPLLDYVINYDFPSTPKLFTHRSGRAGRAGTVGMVHNLVAQHELPYVLDTYEFLGKKLRDVPEEGLSDAPSVTIIDSPDNFLMGVLPMAFLNFWAEFLHEIFRRDGGLDGQAKSASRGYELYAKTCAKPSDKALNETLAVQSTGLGISRIHWWFRETAARHGQSEWSQEEKQVKDLLEKWEPVRKRDRKLAITKQLFEMAKPFEAEILKQKRVENMDNNPELQATDLVRDIVAEAGASGEKASTDAISTQVRELMALQKTQQPRRMSVWQQWRAQQPRFEMNDSSEVSDEMRERALSVRSGGAMGASILSGPLLEVETDDARGSQGKPKRRRVWDKKKGKFVFEEHLNREDARIRRVTRNEAGEKIRLRRDREAEDGGDLYRSWVKHSNVRVQKVGEHENQKMVHKAVAKAVVPLRNKRAGENQLGASILAGAKRRTAAVVTLDPSKHKKSHSELALEKQQRERAKRAAKMKERLAFAKGKERPVPEKLGRAMNLKLNALSRTLKGLRVGKFGMQDALKMQKQKMTQSMRSLSKPDRPMPKEAFTKKASAR